MNEIFEKHKRIYTIIGIFLMLVVLVLYLYALFIPGVWHGDAFLYQQKDGSFKGSDLYAEYKMNIEKTDEGKAIIFSVNDTVKRYDILYDLTDTHRNVKVLENGSVIFSGMAYGTKKQFILLDGESGPTDMVSVRVDSTVPSEEELFPVCSKLYNWSVSEKYDTRGNAAMLFLIILLSAVLFLDVKFPKLFWVLQHRLDVDGGEPSDWYYFGQKIGWVLISAAIFVCVVLTFTLH